VLNVLLRPVLGLLTNVIYTGKMGHKGTIYPDEHNAIVVGSSGNPPV